MSDVIPEPAIPSAHPEAAPVVPDPEALAASPGASRGKVVAWALWDWGTQPFNTVITTFVFAVYITGAPFGGENAVTQAHAWATAAAGAVIALTAPVLGQGADRSGRMVANLRTLTWTLAVLSGALYFVAPAPGYLWFGLATLGVGTVIGEISAVYAYALIVDVSTEKNVGRVSGFGWGMGYLGGIIVLLICAFGFIMPAGDYWAQDGMGTRLSMIVCAVWTLVFTLPTFLALKDKPRTGARERVGIVESYRRLGRSIGRIWRTDRHTMYFLGAQALFRDGLAGVFAFGAVIAAVTFHFTSGEVLMFGAAANVVAGVSTIAFGLLDDRIGPKRVILISLGSLVVLGLAVFFLHDAGKTVFWVAGLLMCMFVGPAQSASRSFLARMIPEGRAGEMFGLYTTTGRVISFLSPVMYGLFIGIGAQVTQSDTTQYWGILGIVLVILAGFCVLLPVREHSRQRGLEAA